MDKLNSLVDKEIEERSTFADILANSLKSDPKIVEILTNISFEKFTRILLIECDLDLDFVTMSQLYKRFTEE